MDRREIWQNCHVFEILKKDGKICFRPFVCKQTLSSSSQRQYISESIIVREIIPIGVCCFMVWWTWWYYWIFLTSYHFVLKWPPNRENVNFDWFQLKLIYLSNLMLQTQWHFRNFVLSHHFFFKMAAILQKFQHCPISTKIDILGSIDVPDMMVLPRKCQFFSEWLPCRIIVIFVWFYWKMAVIWFQVSDIGSSRASSLVKNGLILHPPK